MSKQIDALKLALEALKANQPINYCLNNNGERFPMMQEDPFRFERNTKAITTIKEALAQPEQDPVAWEQFYPDIGKPQLKQLPQLSQEVVLQYPKEAVDWQKQQKEYAQQLKVEGPCHVVCQCDKCKAQEQEPVKDWIASHNEICALLRQAHDALALTSYPPQRAWVGLTNKEFDEIYDSYGTVERAMKAVEAKLKEKNGV